MAAGSWKGSIRFGAMVQFPVHVKGAVRTTTIAFNLHHDPTQCPMGGGRARSGASICDGCGQEIEKEQIVRGYKGVPGIDEGWIDSLEKEKSQLLELDKLVPASQIDARFYAKSYDVIADKGGEKAYVLFLKLLENDGRVALGTLTMGGKEQIVVIRPRAGVLAMELLYWPDEVDTAGTVQEAQASIAGVELTDQELAMGKQLAMFMAGDFEPEAYKNEWAVAMSMYLAAFVAGKTPAPVPQMQKPSPAMDLSAALEASLAAAKAAKKEKAA